MWPVGPEKLWVLWWLVLQVVQPWHGLEQEPVCRACLGAGASNEAAWEAAICRKPLGSARDADVAVDKAKDGCSQHPSKGLSIGAGASDFWGWRGACFYLNILTSFINTCGVGGLHVLETMSPATQIKSAPSQRITESKSLCLTSSLTQDISVEVLLKLSVIPC